MSDSLSKIMLYKYLDRVAVEADNNVIIALNRISSRDPNADYYYYAICAIQYQNAIHRTVSDIYKILAMYGSL